MRELSVYSVIVSIETGAIWKRYFIGRPKRLEVYGALQEDYLNQRADINPEDEGARRMVKFRFANWQKLVEEYWEQDKNMIVCTFAGVTVGNIKITRDSHAVVTQAAGSV